MPRARRVILYADPSGKWRWRTLAGNNRVVRRSEQGFADRSYALADARSDNPGLVVYERDGRRLVQLVAA